MSVLETAGEFKRKISELVTAKRVLISEHGYEELVKDDILIRDAIAGVKTAVIVEYYPEFHKGPCILLLQTDSRNKPLHILWGLPKFQNEPAVIITGYRPDLNLWDSDFLRRSPK